MENRTAFGNHVAPGRHFRRGTGANEAKRRLGQHRCCENVGPLDDQGRRSEIPAVPIRVATEEAPAEDRYVPYSTRLLLRRTGQHLVLAVFDPVSGRISTAEIDMAPPGKEEKRGELRQR